jgi:hypothetical protein
MHTICCILIHILCVKIEIVPFLDYLMTLYERRRLHSVDVRLGIMNYKDFEVITAVVMKSSVFWDIPPCSPLKVDRRFGGTYRLYHQGRRMNQARNRRGNSSLLVTCFHAAFLFDLFLDPEDGDDMILRLTFNWLHSVVSHKTELYMN